MCGVAGCAVGCAAGSAADDFSVVEPWLVVRPQLSEWLRREIQPSAAELIRYAEALLRRRRLDEVRQPVRTPACVSCMKQAFNELRRFKPAACVSWTSQSVSPHTTAGPARSAHTFSCAP